MTKPIRKLKALNREKAQTLLEFALVFPIVLVITYGIFEFARMVFIYAEVTGAAREGARYGAASGTVIDPDTGLETRYYKYCDGIIKAVQDGAILTTIPEANISISYDNGPQKTATWPSCPPIGSNNLDPIFLGDRIEVTVTVTYQPVLGNFLGIKSIPIKSQNARTILLNVETKP